MFTPRGAERLGQDAQNLAPEDQSTPLTYNFERGRSHTEPFHHLLTQRDELIEQLLACQADQPTLLSFFTSKNGEPLKTRLRELALNKLRV